MGSQEYVDLFAKGIVAFFIPLGWAIIFYPLIKKMKESWYGLIIVTSILSLFTFVLKERMDEITPNFDFLFTYALGIFFGIALISLLFNFKLNRLKTPPKDDTFFHKYKIKKNIHLRHLIQVAILIEDEGKEFYERLSVKVKDAAAKNLCRELIKAEINHKKILEDVLFRWLPLSIKRETLDPVIQELRMSVGIYLNSPPADSTEDNLVNYAIEQEIKNADFYLSFEKFFPEAWKRMHIQMIAMAERSHASRLIAAYPHLKPVN